MQKGDWGIGGTQRTPAHRGGRHRRAERWVELLAFIFFFIAVRAGGSSSSSSAESRSIYQVRRPGSGSLAGICTDSSSSLDSPPMTASGTIALSQYTAARRSLGAQ